MASEICTDSQEPADNPNCCGLASIRGGTSCIRSDATLGVRSLLDKYGEQVQIADSE
jgi:hypothetical protein